MSTQQSNTWKQPVSVEQGPSTPRYYQLIEIIREQCAALEPGQPIPTEQEMCQIYSVSRTTVRKALDYLTQEGILYRIQGKGTFIAPPKLRERFVQQAVGIYEDMSVRGVSLRTHVIEQSIVQSSKVVASELQLVVGNPVIKLIRVRYLDDEPLLISTSFHPYRLFPGLESEDLTSVSLYVVLREKYGTRIGKGTRLVEAVPCSEMDAELLHTIPGSPLLVLTGTMYDTEGHLVEYSFSRHRGDRSQIEIEVVS